MDDFLSQETFDLWKEEIRNYNKEKRIQDNKQKWRTEKYQRKCEEIQAEKDEFLKNYMQLNSPLPTEHCETQESYEKNKDNLFQYPGLNNGDDVAWVDPKIDELRKLEDELYVKKKSRLNSGDGYPNLDFEDENCNQNATGGITIFKSKKPSKKKGKKSFKGVLGAESYPEDVVIGSKNTQNENCDQVYGFNVGNDDWGNTSKNNWFYQQVEEDIPNDLNSIPISLNPSKKKKKKGMKKVTA